MDLTPIMIVLNMEKGEHTIVACGISDALDSNGRWRMHVHPYDQHLCTNYKATDRNGLEGRKIGQK